MGLDFLKEELNSQKEEKKKIKQEKKDAKAREQDAKKQKKIKDFINLNDDLEINNNINNEKINEVNDSNDDNSSINSDNESVFDDVFGNDAINITNQELKKENIIKSKIDIPENEFIDFEF
jgi:hypothetical protein